MVCALASTGSVALDVPEEKVIESPILAAEPIMTDMASEPGNMFCKDMLAFWR